MDSCSELVCWSMAEDDRATVGAKPETSVIKL